MKTQIVSTTSVLCSTYCMLADNSEEFKKQVASLARLLQLPESDNVEEVLQVCFFSRLLRSLTVSSLDAGNLAGDLDQVLA